MDECLDIVTGLWSRPAVRATPASTTRSTPTEFPTIGDTVQQPRVPIWCVGALGPPKSMARALRWDGLLPQVVDDGGARQPTLDEIAGAARGARRPRPTTSSSRARARSTRRRRGPTPARRGGSSRCGTRSARPTRARRRRPLRTVRPLTDPNSGRRSDVPSDTRVEVGGHPDGELGTAGSAH